MDNFISIWGPPRTGTSVLSQLVELCGYNFGEANQGEAGVIGWNTGNGSHEHKIASTSKYTLSEAAHLISIQNINALKFIGFYQLIPHIKSMGYNVKIIGTNRLDDKARADSTQTHIIDKSSHEIPNHDKFKNDQLKIYDARETMVKEHGFDYLVINFEDIMEKKEDTLVSICEFIDVKPTEELLNKMKQVIKPKVSKYYNK